MITCGVVSSTDVVHPESPAAPEQICLGITSGYLQRAVAPRVFTRSGTAAGLSDKSTIVYIAFTYLSLHKGLLLGVGGHSMPMQELAMARSL